MTARYVRYTFLPETITRCGKLSVLRFVTLTLGDGTMVRCYRHDQEDGGIAHTFQPCSTETFKSPSGTIYQRGYGLYVVDDASDEFFSVTNSADVLNSLLESFRQDGISVKHATVCDEVIPCTSLGNLMDKKLYTLTTRFTVSSDYQCICDSTLKDS